MLLLMSLGSVPWPRASHTWWATVMADCVLPKPMPCCYKVPRNRSSAVSALAVPAASNAARPSMPAGTAGSANRELNIGLVSFCWIVFVKCDQSSPGDLADSQQILGTRRKASANNSPRIRQALLRILSNTRHHEDTS